MNMVLMTVYELKTSVTELKIPTSGRTVWILDSNDVLTVLDLESLLSRVSLTGMPWKTNTVVEVSSKELFLAASSLSSDRSKNC